MKLKFFQQCLVFSFLCFIYVLSSWADSFESFGISTEGVSSKALFRTDILIADKSKTNNIFEVTEGMSISAQIKIDSKDIGKIGSIYVVAFFENSAFFKIGDNAWEVWQEPHVLDTLLPNRGPHSLESQETINITKQFYGQEGKYIIYMGYKIDNNIIYNAQPFKFFIKRSLNDTGSLVCLDSSSKSKTCLIDHYPGQDATYGRDFEAVSGTLAKKGDGLGGFDFSKIADNGDVLPNNATEWSCIRDNVTGLLWEAKKEDGKLHDKSWKFTWFEQNIKNNASFEGVAQTPGVLCTNQSVCNTFAFVQSVNQEGWCGQNNWRLPSVDELTNITNLNLVIPAIDESYFKYTQSLLNDLYWSSTPVVKNNQFAWAVDFFAGQNKWKDKSSRQYVRLVADLYHP